MIMKRSLSFLSALIVALVATSAVAADKQNDIVAKVYRLTGSARYNTGDGNWKDLHRGDVLRPGTIVQTADKSRVDLVLGESDNPIPRPVMGEALTFHPDAQQNVVRIWENTTLGIDKLNVMKSGGGDVSETELDLQKGHIFGTVKRMSPASSYRVKIPNGVAAIRGTVYDLTAEGLLRVLYGTVVLDHVGPGGEHITQTVSQNQEYDARTMQIIPLTDPIKDGMSFTARQTFLPLATPSVITPDHTIYPVSTTTGQ